MSQPVSQIVLRIASFPTFPDYVTGNVECISFDDHVPSYTYSTVYLFVNAIYFSKLSKTQCNNVKT